MLNVNLHPQVTRIARQLILATFGGADQIAAASLDNSGAPLFGHPMGRFEQIGLLADRINYRLPDQILAEGGLDLHIDRNALDPWANLQFWRPIQAFVALTDQYGGESGGLRCVRGFHARSDYDVARGQDKAALAKGAFNRLPSKRHQSLVDQCMPVDCPAGSIVFWDNRLPHATAQTLKSTDTREVVYCSFVPLCGVNVDAIDAQRIALERNLQPPHYAASRDAPGDRDWALNELTEEQSAMLGFSS